MRGSWAFDGEADIRWFEHDGPVGEDNKGIGESNKGGDSGDEDSRKEQDQHRGDGGDGIGDKDKEIPAKLSVEHDRIFEEDIGVQPGEKT